MDEWPFLWEENEYVIGIGATCVFLANAAHQLLADCWGGERTFISMTLYEADVR